MGQWEAGSKRYWPTHPWFPLLPQPNSLSYSLGHSGSSLPFRRCSMWRALATALSEAEACLVICQLMFLIFLPCFFPSSLTPYHHQVPPNKVLTYQPCLKLFLKTKEFYGDFPVGQVVKIPCFHRYEPSWNPSWETRSHNFCWLWLKKKKWNYRSQII